MWYVITAIDSYSTPRLHDTHPNETSRLPLEFARCVASEGAGYVGGSYSAAVNGIEVAVATALKMMVT